MKNRVPRKLKKILKKQYTEREKFWRTVIDISIAIPVYKALEKKIVEKNLFKDLMVNQNVPILLH